MCAIASVIVVILADVVAATRVLRSRRFWIFLAVMYVFMTVVNGYLTWRPIVLYGEDHILGVRLFTIPLEDYLYGFGLMAASVIGWEYLLQRAEKQPSSENTTQTHTSSSQAS
jgi:lycopene cyclase domain-containing protein